MKPILTLSHISYAYHTPSGEVPAINNLSFDIYDGEFLAIVGPSGCGKSTMLNILAGLQKPEEGTIRFENPDGSLRYPTIGYMLQRDELLPWKTIWHNITLGAVIRHKLDDICKEKALYFLQKYQLDKFKDSYPNELSGGMRQRVALIRTLLLSPDILLLDEPFSALDYQTRLNVSDDIGRIIREEQKTAVLITHDLSEAISLADRIIVLSKRPATVQKVMDIHLTKEDESSLSSRNAKEFPVYFNALWKELNQ